MLAAAPDGEPERPRLAAAAHQPDDPAGGYRQSRRGLLRLQGWEKSGPATAVFSLPLAAA
ncbi:MAG: hypothetical protein U1E35_03610 [Rhodospirillales bacterium]